MRKIFLLSFDDGVIWDQWFAEMLNHYKIPCTFNLNTGLEDFVWHYEDRFPVRRLRLAESTHFYDGHWLKSLTDDQLRHEVGDDVAALKKLFQKEKLGFAVPFTACGEREVDIIRPYVSYIRLSEMKDDFDLPKDPYHIYINALFNEPNVREKIRAFAENDAEVSCFVMAGHTYEFEVLHQWEYMEDLLRYIQSLGVEFMTTMDFVEEFFG